MRVVYDSTHTFVPVYLLPSSDLITKINESIICGAIKPTTVATSLRQLHQMDVANRLVRINSIIQSRVILSHDIHTVHRIVCRVR